MSTSHDRIFKEFLTRFLPQFLHTFFPAIAARLDLTRYTVLGQELLSNFPVQHLRITDFVAEVPTLAGETEIVLVHIEIEAGRWTQLPARMFEYYALLRLQRQKPVVPLALVLQPGAGGLAWQSYDETLFDEPLLHFRYGQVGLRDLTPAPYQQADNPVAAALTALMDLSDNDPAVVKLTALRTVANSGLTEGDKLFLIDVIGTYLATETLPPSGTETMDALREFEMTWLEAAHNEGLEQGMHDSILSLLDARFGPVAPAIAARIEQIDDTATLRRLVRLAGTADSAAAFAAGLTDIA